MKDRTSVVELEHRHEMLSNEIARVEGEISSLGGAELALRRERAELAAQIDQQRPPAPSILDRTRVASPCPADWNKMTGDDRVRFCGECKEHVYNITNMTRREAEALLTANSSACIRYFERADGTIMTKDCPVGVQKKQRRKVALAVIGGTAMWGAGMVAAVSSVGGVVKQALDEQEQLEQSMSEPQALPVLRGPTNVSPMPHTSPATPTPVTPSLPNGHWRGGRPSINRRGGDFF